MEIETSLADLMSEKAKDRSSADCTAKREAEAEGLRIQLQKEVEATRQKERELLTETRARLIARAMSFKGKSGCHGGA